MFRLIPTCVLSLAVTLAIACGTPDVEMGAAAVTPNAVSPPDGVATQIGEIKVLGTITATLSGTERTWHVVAGPSQGHPYSSAVWLETATGRRTVSTPAENLTDPPIENLTDRRGDEPQVVVAS
jgi:hypothetical protein